MPPFYWKMLITRILIEGLVQTEWPVKGTKDTDSIKSGILSLLSISFVNSQLVSLERITASQALGHNYNYRCGLRKAEADELIRNKDLVCWTVYLVWRTKSGRVDESPCKQIEQSPTHNRVRVPQPTNTPLSLPWRSRVLPLCTLLTSRWWAGADWVTVMKLRSPHLSSPAPTPVYFATTRRGQYSHWPWMRTLKCHFYLS